MRASRAAFMRVLGWMPSMDKILVMVSRSQPMARVASRANAPLAADLARDVRRVSLANVRQRNEGELTTRSLLYLQRYGVEPLFRVGR